MQTEVLCQILQAQQHMAQQLQQMQPMQQKPRTFEPSSPGVPTQTDIDTNVGAIHMLKGQNLVISQIVHDIIQGCYRGLSQTSLAVSLSQSLFVSMVEQACLFNLLVDHVNQDQLNTSDSILPPSKLPMDLRKEERKSRSNKLVLSEIDVSEWGIIYKEIRPREAKRSCNIGKIDQPLEIETRSQAGILEERKGKKPRLVKKDQQQVLKPKKLPHLCYNCKQPKHFIRNCPNPKQLEPQQQNQNPGAAEAFYGKKPIFQVKPDQLNFMGNISIREHLPTSSFIFEYQDEILLKGGRL
jgi:hypothetical protein